MRRISGVSGVVILLLVAGITLTACGPQPAETVELTAGDSGSTEAMSVGQELRITLDSNPTTGYSWALDGELPPQLEQVGEPVYTAESSALGAGGTEVWAFKAMSSGSGTLRLKYWRSFEPDATPPETFDVTVEVE